MTNINVVKLRDELKEHERLFCYCGNLLKTNADVERTMHEACAKRLGEDRQINMVKRESKPDFIWKDAPVYENTRANICTTCKLVEQCGGVNVAVNMSGDDTGKPSQHARELAEKLGIYLIGGWIDFRKEICDKNQGE
jgi:hypothetical protein